MDVKIITCPNCRKMFKIVNIKNTGKRINYITDFGDIFKEQSCNHYKCIKCNKIFIIENNIISTESWIADAVFTVRGN